MRAELQELYSKIAGRDVFIIGGGPSFKNVDKTLLSDKNVVCLNTAYREFENPTALYWCDESWVANHYDNITNHKCKLRFTGKHAADGYITKGIKGTCNSTVLKRTGDFGFDSTIDHVRGNNSGAHALNLMVNMHPKRIILLGYDMKMKDGKSHFHEGHGLPMSNYIYNELFIPSINSMAPFIKNVGIEVINCSEGSALECFPKQNLKDIL